MIARFPSGGVRHKTGPWIDHIDQRTGLVSLFDCWHCVDITIKKLRAICDLARAVAHLFLFGTPIGSWKHDGSSSEAVDIVDAIGKNGGKQCLVGGLNPSEKYESHLG